MIRLAAVTGWSRAEILDLDIDEFRADLAAADRLAAEQQLDLLKLLK